MLSGEDQTLLVRGDSLLVLDLALNIVNRIGGLDLKGDGLARKGLDEAVVCQSRIRRFSRFRPWWRGVFGELTSALLMKNVSKYSTGSDITKNTWL